jgi:hypothetical protein
VQLLSQDGCAHVVRTLAKPASLPPTLIVTYAFAADSALSWLFVTSATVAPEQARKFRAYPFAAAMSEGYAYTDRWQVDPSLRYERVPTPDE